MITPSPVVTEAWRDVMSLAGEYGVTFRTTKQQLLQVAANLDRALDTWLAAQPGDPQLLISLLYEIVRRRVGK